MGTFGSTQQAWSSTALRRGAAAVSVAAMTLLGTSPAHAGELNDRHRTVNADSFRGKSNIRTDPATVTGVGYVHAAQVGFANTTDFLAIGTTKGVGVSNCADDYDALWGIYTDGSIGGDYFCTDQSLDVYDAGSNPTFAIERGWCPSQSATRWNLYLGGTLWSCIAMGGVTSTNAVKGVMETTGVSNVDRNIDVRFNEMEYRLAGLSTFNDFGTGTQVTFPSYSNDYIDPRRYFLYLAPAD